MKIDLIIMFIVWFFFSMFEGHRDGAFYHNQNTSSHPVKENLHWLFTATRGIVLCLITIITLYAYPNQITLRMILGNFFPNLPMITTIFISSLIMVFSFLHNGTYYYVRNRFDSNVYPKGFWSDSVSSTATFEISAITRTIMAVIGIIGVIMSIIM